MKKFLLFIFLVILAVSVAFLMHEDPGYAMISFHHWVISTTIWIFATTILIAFFAFYFLMRMLTNIFSIPKKLAHRRELSHLEQFQTMITEGLESYAIGDYKKAEKKFAMLAEKNKSTINYLLAAKAAQAQKEIKHRNEYLEKAATCSKKEEFVIALTKAQLFMACEQEDDALLILKSLHNEQPKNTLILSMLKTIYFNMQNWEALKLLADQLKKNDLLSSQELSRIKMPISG